jgi:hypothetical protein
MTNDSKRLTWKSLDVEVKHPDPSAPRDDGSSAQCDQAIAQMSNYQLSAKLEKTIVTPEAAAVAQKSKPPFVRTDAAKKIAADPSGHSFLTYAGLVIDPWLMNKGANEHDVQKVGNFLLSACQTAGVKCPSPVFQSGEIAQPAPPAVTPAPKSKPDNSKSTDANEDETIAS